MNTPPLLVGAALAYWGWRMDLLWLGLLLGALLEGARPVSIRWEFRQPDLDRLWNFCVVLYFGVLIYGFAVSDYGGSLQSLVSNPSPANRVALVNRGARSMFFLFQWMPVAFFAMAAAQAYGTERRMDWSTFSWWLRRVRATAPRTGQPRLSGVNVAYPYFALCILAASAIGPRQEPFFAGISILVGWALWPQRPRTMPAPVWLGCLALVLGLGYGGQLGFIRLRRALEQLDSAILSRLVGGSTDARESRTRIGTLGELKLSGRIVLRLEGVNPPGLLHEASYNLFRSPIWVASRREFSSILAESDQITWSLHSGPVPSNEIRLAMPVPGGQRVLPLPHGSIRLEELPVFLLESNRLGVVRSAEGPGFVDFRIRYGTDSALASGPDADDLEVPDSEQAAVGRIADELGLPSNDAPAAVARVSEFFSRHFRYTTYLGADPAERAQRSSLAGFLLKRRAGHCEYFATATTLLLRQAGIPARYAVGYAVDEQKGGEFIVRERHGHAWCLAWLNHGWHPVDTTPASWRDAENQRASWWESISDTWSRLKFAAARWRSGRSEVRKYLGWVVIPLVGALAAQLIFRRQWRRASRRGSTAHSSATVPGADSEFYLIEQKLAASGLERWPGESLLIWTQRVQNAGIIHGPELSGLLALHYRLRFDPAGLTKAERRRFAEQVSAWLKRHERRMSPTRSG